MGVSKDMIDVKAGDLRFPEKWRSSIAAFYHEPAELPPEYCNRTITYLKVVCTITNYQLYGSDATVLDDLRASNQDFYAWKAFDSNLTQSYPCHGALLQVSVFPNPAEGVAIQDFPYISAFQPRKREMYETLSESGEVGSQSASRVNVGKQLTNSDTTETFDVMQGYSYSDSASVLFGLGSGSGSESIEGQWGTIDRSERQDQHVTTADSSREKRENYAFSTSVNQLYSLLQGYHLGTNRALFFMQPRPHIQNAKFSFIRGPRQLEGIQEFFLIIDRPADTPGFCVELALETAHLYLHRTYEPRFIPLGDLYSPRNLGKTAEALGIDPANYPYQVRLAQTWNRFWPWVRALAHEAAKRDLGSLPGEIERLLNSGSMTRDEWSALQEVTGKLPDVGTEDIALVFEEYELDSGEMFLTGRRMCACAMPGPRDEDDKVDCEGSQEHHVSTCDDAPSITFEVPFLGVPFSKKRVILDKVDAADLNLIVQQVNEALWSSVGSTRRVEYGAISYLETDFMLDELSHFLRLRVKGSDERLLSEIESLAPWIERGLGTTSGARTIQDLSQLTNQSIARDLGVLETDARKSRREILTTVLSNLPDDQSESHERVNPIEDRLAWRFPAETLSALEVSAGVVRGGPTLPASGRASRRVPSVFRGWRRGP